ncbi:MAG TPA: SPFH domain-containing protein [Thermoanaerobaculia bacterium]|nr:SPFH domain-containing protein [Thermoanaerobaculia bacterium]
MSKEHSAVSLPGIPVLLFLLAGIVFGVFRMIHYLRADELVGVLLSLLGMATAILLLVGLFMVEPNQARVLTLFGAYRGSERRTGLRWANPFYAKRQISLRVRNFETEHLKVNDLDGNPIEIASVVVWRVVDSFEAVFHVDNYENFVHVQSESALRNLTTHFSYDAHTDDVKSLRGSTAEIAEQLRTEIRDRLEQAGVDVLEARISHLAYAPEIAHAMLQRQQASAIIAARQKIVDGAVGMVEMALDHLEKKNIVHLDPERRAAMVSNLLVVLCSDRAVTPVVNTGTLY